MNDVTFRLKICGVRRVEDVDLVADSGGDAIGLNLFRSSVRYVDPDSTLAADIVRRAHERGVLVVAVVVERSAEQINGFHDRLGLDAIQWHGDQRVADLRRSNIAIPQLRAVKLPAGTLSPSQISAAVDPWIEAGFDVLLDADVGAAHGGQGQRLDWSSIGRWSASRPDVPFVLAGGLKPDSVAEAITRSTARRVDVASGVELPQGTKNAALTDAFCRAAAGAWSIGRALDSKAPRLD